MAFGQPTGPPASAHQLRELTALIEAAGHTGFKDARGPLGLNQRQAGGRFTRDEAAAMIARLEAEAEAGAGPPTGDDGSATTTPRTAVAPRRTASRTPGAASTSLADQLQRVPEELLVAELRRRGWALIPPSLAT